MLNVRPVRETGPTPGIVPVAASAPEEAAAPLLPAAPDALQGERGRINDGFTPRQLGRASASAWREGVS